MRSVAAASRRAAREHDRAMRARQKEREIQAAQDSVEEFEWYLHQIRTIHLDAAPLINWDCVGPASLPPAPKRTTYEEEKARARLASYKPGFVSRLFRDPEKKRSELSKGVEIAAQKDTERFERDLIEYENNKNKAEKELEEAQPILCFNPEKMREYFSKTTNLENIIFLRDSVNIDFRSDGTARAEIFVHSEDIVPDEKLSQLASGRLSKKRMPKKEYYSIYQDYVCSAALLIMIELFNILPLKSVVINVKDNILNKKNGHIEEAIILSYFAPRETFEMINFEAVDPSESMENFLHEMKFRPTTGFAVVQEVAVPTSRSEESESTSSEVE